MADARAEAGSGSESEVESEIAEMSSISRGAVLFGIGLLVQTLFTSLMTVVLTRGLGASMYGTFSYGQTIIDIASRFAKLGTTQSVLRFLPEKRESLAKQNEVLGLTFGTALVGSLLAAGLLYALSPTINRLTLDNDHLTVALQLFAILLPLFVLVRVIADVFRSVERPEAQISVQKVLYPLSQMLAVLVAVLLGYSLFGVIGSLIVAGAVAFLISGAFFASTTDFRPTLRVDRDEAREFYSYSIPLTLSAAGGLLINRVDILLVGYFLTDTDVGIYSVAILVSTFVGMPLTGLNQLFPPIASRLHSDGERAKLNDIFATVTRWAFTLSLVATIGAILYREELLYIFGEEFTAGAMVLVLFLFAQITRNVAGPSGYLLAMTGHQYVVLVNKLVLGGLNVVLTVAFILEFGLIGAALGSALSLAAINVLRVIEIYYFEGYLPYTRALYKPVLAAGVATGLMWAVAFLVDGLPLLVAGSAMGALVYGLSLYVLGLESEDRALLVNVLSMRE